MVAAKRSISLSPELAECIRALAAERSEDVSRLIETLLREHPLTQAKIAEQRGRAGLKKGRDIDALRILARQARRRWDERVASGQVKVTASRR
ncbi:MAG TPA: hypothetical protein VM370_06250 [Candidatus Thermoplasmatota archaeon]|nr:hypothetical protein [Candidatus Thermoplasmatota archaeon]